MKKLTSLLISLAVLCAVAIDGYILFFNRDHKSSSETQQKTTSSGTKRTTASHQLKAGQYTGTTVDTNRGAFQVRIKVAGGKIAKVTVLKSPEDGRSQQINQQAIPIYTKEALAAQSAKINQVSGATETYRGFTGSLQDAIKQAQIA